jgi:putative endonuclease
VNAFEQAAEAFLTRRGYRVIGRNYRAPGGEIDLVAREGSVLCFVEVRARRSSRFGTPEETVGPHKQRRLRLAAARYLAEHGDAECRFDVVAMTPEGIRLIKDAF